MRLTFRFVSQQSRLVFLRCAALLLRIFVLRGMWRAEERGFDMSDKKGLSCSGLIGATVFVIVAGVIIVNFAGKKEEKVPIDTTTAVKTSVITTINENQEQPNDEETEENYTQEPNSEDTTQETTAETEETTTYETENPDIIWLDRSLGLFLNKKTEKGSTQDGFITITGAIGNGSLNNYSYVAINFTIRDKNGLKIGDAFDNISGLKSGDAWRFEATGYAKGAASFEFESITAW